MNARRLRILVGSAIAAGLLAASVVAPAVAVECAMSAPDSSSVGSTLTIDGTGFPASSSVDLELSIEGGASEAFKFQTNAAGRFQVSLDLEAADEGVATFNATAGPDCAAQVIVTVFGAGEALLPADVPAGVAAGASAEPAAPRTDAGPTTLAHLTTTNRDVWLGAFLVLGIGLGGLLATRPARSRRPRG